MGELLDAHLFIKSSFHIFRRIRHEIELKPLALVIRPPQIVEYVVPQLRRQARADIDIGLAVAPDEILTALRSGSVEGILGIG